MKNITVPLLLFIAILLGGAWFIQSTSAQLPEMVAAHFNAAGAANRFRDRQHYTHMMLGFVLLVPNLVVVAMSVLPRVAPELVNLPNRDFWLAPERREATLNFLLRHALFFASALVIFMCSVHWQVVQANRQIPVHLYGARIYPVVFGFIAFIAIWVGAMLRRFRLP